MADDGEDSRPNRTGEPTALKYVGPATATVIEAARFDADAIRERRVSYRELVDAGINPGVAAKLRREFSLVWSFEWAPGADLARRASLVTGLEPGQRDWVAASTSREPAGKPATDDVSTGERRWRDRAEWVAAADKRQPPSTCPRCDGDLMEFEFGDHRSIQCDDCGYVGLSTDVGRDRAAGSATPTIPDRDQRSPEELPGRQP